MRWSERRQTWAERRGWLWAWLWLSSSVPVTSRSAFLSCWRSSSPSGWETSSTRSVSISSCRHEKLRYLKTYYTYVLTVDFAIFVCVVFRCGEGERVVILSASFLISTYFVCLRTAFTFCVCFYCCRIYIYIRFRLCLLWCWYYEVRLDWLL